MMQVIEVVVSPTGETKIQTTGFIGSGCRDASRFLEDALGASIGEQLTNEFHQTAAQRQSAQERS